jgi:hypothetical protein
MRIPSSLSLVLLSSLSLFSIRSEARWALPSDAGSEIEYENVSISVKADGTYTMTAESVEHLLKDGERVNFSNHRLYYNSRASKLKILEAKTINDGQTIAVDVKNLEDKPLASSPTGFDEIHQILVAFPEVKVGSKVFLKYTLEYNEVPFPGIFAESFSIGREELSRKGKIVIDSEIPLDFRKNDPVSALKVDSKTVNGKTHLEITQNDVIYVHAVDEDDPFFLQKRYVWIDIGNAKTWEDLVKPILPQYEEVLSAKLPEKFEKIRAAAEPLGADPIAQINTITSHLQEEVRYLGDWRPRRGGYVPKPLADIAASSFADCKEFSASTVSILRSLGYDAHVAFVYRGLRLGTHNTDMPSNSFNHAIVYATKGGKEYWVDPTNDVSFAQVIGEDIIDRPSLVLDAKKPYLARIPAADPQTSVMRLATSVSLADPEAVQVSGIFENNGRSAIYKYQIGLYKSVDSAKYDLISKFTDINNVKNWDMTGYPEKPSRIVKDITLGYRYVESGTALKTSAGMGYKLPHLGLLSKFQTRTSGRVSDLFLGQPMTFEREVSFTDLKRVGREPLSCKIDSPWIQAIRDFTPQNKDYKLTEKIVIKSSVVSSEELQSSEYTKLRTDLQRCFENVALIYTPTPRAKRQLSGM